MRDISSLIPQSYLRSITDVPGGRAGNYLEPVVEGMNREPGGSESNQADNRREEETEISEITSIDGGAFLSRYPTWSAPKLARERLNFPIQRNDQSLLRRVFANVERRRVTAPPFPGIMPWSPPLDEIGILERRRGLPLGSLTEFSYHAY